MVDMWYGRMKDKGSLIGSHNVLVDFVMPSILSITLSRYLVMNRI